MQQLITGTTSLLRQRRWPGPDREGDLDEDVACQLLPKCLIKLPCRLAYEGSCFWFQSLQLARLGGDLDGNVASWRVFKLPRSLASTAQVSDLKLAHRGGNLHGNVAGQLLAQCLLELSRELAHETVQVLCRRRTEAVGQLRPRQIVQLQL